MRSDANDAVLGELRRRGLAAPARLLLVAHRPLRPLLANAAVFLSPLARPLLGERLEPLERALDDDEAYANLIRGLDDEDR